MCALGYFIGLFLIALALWTQKFFGTVTIEQALSTLNFGFDGVFASDSIFIKRFMVWCLFWPCIVTIFLIMLKLFCAYQLKRRNNKVTFLTIINKINQPYSSLIVGIFFIFPQYEIGDYLKNSYSSSVDYFATNYVNPKDIHFQLEKPKSLVLIYVESLEATYSDQQVFGRDLLQSLHRYDNIGVSFAHYRQMPGTGWTIAGIVSTQCGIPLKDLTILSGNRLGENINQYLPNAKCLSDILAEQGYKNVFLNGARARFGGKLSFLRSHHYTEIYGKNRWLKMGLPQSEMSNWGLSDHELLNQAKIKLAALIADKKPFNLTILTVDTHGYDGQLSASCKNRGYNDFAGIVECTAVDVADFVDYIVAHGWLKQVDIVILGDHLAMENPVYDKLTAAPSRSIFNLFISQQLPQKCSDDMMEFGMLPSILKLMGFNFNGNKLGLGYNGFRSSFCPRPETYVSDTYKYINNYSKAYERLWTTHVA